jgi:kynureninase
MIGLQRSDAETLDANDPLASLRASFHIPRRSDGTEATYLCGHSLGLAPKRALQIVNEELNVWARHGVDGHFDAERPWVSYHEHATRGLSLLTGARPIEVVAMNSLTVNLHLLLSSFYRPHDTRNKILMESYAFSSDRYAIESQLRIHDLDPDDALLLVSPRRGEDILRTEDVCSLIHSASDSLATVLLPSVQYLTGQSLDLAAITRSAHQVGSTVGFDLAHAIGNVPLRLHDWNVDFAVWCSYKYLNSGPGAIGGAFIHERHARSDLPRLAGWWGHDKSSRFAMPAAFAPLPGAEGWQISNPSVLATAPLLASLALFEEAGLDRLRAKSEQLTSYLETLLLHMARDSLTILTPTAPSARGCQLSIRVNKSASVARAIHAELTDLGFICDWREPDVIRVAPVPLYNTFVEVWEFADALSSLIKTASTESDGQEPKCSGTHGCGGAAPSPAPGAKG